MSARILVRSACSSIGVSPGADARHRVLTLCASECLQVHQGSWRVAARHRAEEQDERGVDNAWLWMCCECGADLLWRASIECDTRFPGTVADPRSTCSRCSRRYHIRLTKV